MGREPTLVCTLFVYTWVLLRDLLDVPTNVHPVPSVRGSRGKGYGTEDTDLRTPRTIPDLNDVDHPHPVYTLYNGCCGTGSVPKDTEGVPRVGVRGTDTWTTTTTRFRH